eukprot:769197-Alexandrium_andersonii.AAC.1
MQSDKAYVVGAQRLRRMLCRTAPADSRTRRVRGELWASTSRSGVCEQALEFWILASAQAQKQNCKLPRASHADS